MEDESNGRGRFDARRTLRLSAEENERLARQADAASISVSEYIRRLCFGGRPITSRTDSQTIRELRRLGGLLKHNFENVREAAVIRLCRRWKLHLRQSDKPSRG